MDQRLKAEKIEFYEGRAIIDPATGKTMRLTDNGIRQRATELLADLHGRRRQKVDHNLSGDLEHTHVHVYLPDNGRGNEPSPDSGD